MTILQTITPERAAQLIKQGAGWSISARPTNMRASAFPARSIAR